MNKKERREYILRRAKELAKTGNFSGWLSIEHYIRSKEGLQEARSVLDNQWLRKELDRLCSKAKRSTKSN